jgi:Potato inhibitor I family
MLSTLAHHKTSWPELKGKTGREAKHIIQEEYPFLHVNIVRESNNSPPMLTTEDYRTDRVQVVVNQTGIVVRTPKVG